MITVKCYFENNDTMITRINATFEEAKEYYLNNLFNMGTVRDNIKECINIELLKDNEI